MEEGEEDESPVETFTCMHACFYREHLVTAFEECLSPSGNLSRHLQMVRIKHKPLEMFHAELVIATEKRNDLVSLKAINRLTGKYMKLELKADVSQQCECGTGYEQNSYKKQGNATMYTRICPVECAYYNLE